MRGKRDFRARKRELAEERSESMGRGGKNGVKANGGDEKKTVTASVNGLSKGTGKLNQIQQPVGLGNSGEVKNDQAFYQMLQKKTSERISWISSREHPNFNEYIRSRDKNLGVPNNCIHVEIAYFAYFRQGNVKEDPTEVGRKIKRAHFLVFL